METIVVETNQLTDKTQLDILVTEILNNLIPQELKTKISSKKSRKQLLQKFGNKAFLIPQKLKFPIMNPETGNYECSLIYAEELD